MLLDPAVALDDAALSPGLLACTALVVAPLEDSAPVVPVAAPAGVGVVPLMAQNGIFKRRRSPMHIDDDDADQAMRSHVVAVRDVSRTRFN